MQTDFYKQARDMAFHLNNLAADYRKDGRTETAKDMLEASLIIKILLNNIEVRNKRLD